MNANGEVMIRFRDKLSPEFVNALMQRLAHSLLSRYQIEGITIQVSACDQEAVEEIIRGIDPQMLFSVQYS